MSTTTSTNSNPSTTLNAPSQTQTTTSSLNSNSLTTSETTSPSSSRCPTPLSTLSTTAIFHGHAGHPTLTADGKPMRSAGGANANAQSTGKHHQNPNRALEATRLRLGGFAPRARVGDGETEGGETPRTDSREESIRKAKGVGPGVVPAPGKEDGLEMVDTALEGVARNRKD